MEREEHYKRSGSRGISADTGREAFDAGDYGYDDVYENNGYRRNKRSNDAGYEHYERGYGERTGYEKDLRSSRRHDGEVVEHREHRSRRNRAASPEKRNDSGYYEDRNEYFRERDRYFAERDKYYQERDRYYSDMDEYSKIASSAADEAYAEAHAGKAGGNVSDGEYYDDDAVYERNRRSGDHTNDGRTPDEGRNRAVTEHTDRADLAAAHRNEQKRNVCDTQAENRTPQRRQSADGVSNTANAARQARMNDSMNMHTGSGRADGRSGGGNGNQNGRSEKKTGKKKKILLAVLALLLIAAAYIGFKFVKRQSGYYTVAVFGVDSRNGNVGKSALSDVNIIARVDMATGEIKLVSIYRDTYTQIDKDGNYHKFNEAYFRGGPEQAVWALEHNTDVKVDDYVTFNWKAVVDAINILGGVDIDISDAEFKYINAYITETVNSTGVGSVQLQHAGMNHLDGVQAVAYARLRKMDDDYTRTERQRKVISLAMEKAKNADFSVLNNILVTVLPQTSTSVGISDLLPFAKNISKYYIGETAGFPFDKKGQNIGKLDAVIPVTWESNDIALHEFLYPGVPYTPSRLVKEISAHVAEKTGLGGSGETSVKTDDLVTGKPGSEAIQETSQPAESESVSESESESETETIEEIIDESEYDDEFDNDSYNDEDLVPNGSNNGTGHGSGSYTDISSEPEDPYDSVSTGPTGPASEGPGSGQVNSGSGTEDRSDAIESVAATKAE